MLIIQDAGYITVCRSFCVLCQMLRQRYFEPLQSAVQKLHYNGHALVLSAAPTVKTSHIIDALDDLDEVWNELAANVIVIPFRVTRDERI